MNIKTIPNAFVHNKPNYNYDILDDEGTKVATGHLLNARQKQLILKHMNTTIDTDGKIIPNIDSYIQFSAEWIMQSLDSWIFSDTITKQLIFDLSQQITIWLVQQIRIKNDESVSMVQSNEKN